MLSGQVMPLAFLARTDEDADVAKLWADVWEEGSMSQAAALRLYISDLAPLLLESGFAHQPLALPDILSRHIEILSLRYSEDLYVPGMT